MSRRHEKPANHHLKELHDAFNLFDQDKSGTISSSELKQVLVALHLKPTDSLVRKLMREMDTDDNGTVDFQEFVRVMGSIYERKFTDEEMRRAFRCFDTDNSGFITANELRDVLRRLHQNFGERQITDILNRVDADHDGKISYEEFVHMLEDV